MKKLKYLEQEIRIISQQIDEQLAVNQTHERKRENRVRLWMGIGGVILGLIIGLSVPRHTQRDEFGGIVVMPSDNPFEDLIPSTGKSSRAKTVKPKRVEFTFEEAIGR